MSSIRISETLARRFNLPPVVVHDILIAAFAEIEGMARDTGRCEVRPLGVFKLKRAAPRSRRNPAPAALSRFLRRSKLVFAHSSTRAKALTDQLLAAAAGPLQDSTHSP